MGHRNPRGRISVLVVSMLAPATGVYAGNAAGEEAMGTTRNSFAPTAELGVAILPGNALTGIEDRMLLGPLTLPSTRAVG